MNPEDKAVLRSLFAAVIYAGRVIDIETAYQKADAFIGRVETDLKAAEKVDQ